jgi:tetratricopeptide (TPR) repeat protein
VVSHRASSTSGGLGGFEYGGAGMKVADLATGVVLNGRFRLVRLLGRGSYGDVWLVDALADPQLPSQVALTSIPEPLDALVMRCLEKRPDRRHATGAELLAAIEGLQVRLQEPDQPITAPARQPECIPSRTEDMEHARDFIAQGRFNEAAEHLEPAMQCTNPNRLLLYAAANQAMGKLEVAHGAYMRAIRWLTANDAEPTTLREAIEGRSELDVRLKRYDEAAEGYAWLVEHRPEKRWYRFRSAVALGLAGRYSDAAEVLQALHSDGPASGLICAKLGFGHRQMGHIEVAVQFFNEALMLDQYEPVALAQLAEIRTIQGRMDKAEQYLTRLERVEGAEEEVRGLRRKLGKSSDAFDAEGLPSALSPARAGS